MAIAQIMTNNAGVGVGAAKSLGGKRMKRESSADEEEENIDEKQNSLAEQQPNMCACNATYISTSCCWSDEGYVWEPPGLKVRKSKRNVLFSSSIEEDTWV